MRGRAIHRAWAMNDNARETIDRAMQREPRLRVTTAAPSDAALVDAAIGKVDHSLMP